LRLFTVVTDSDSELPLHIREGAAWLQAIDILLALHSR